MGANHSYRSLKTREAPSLGSAAWHQPDARRPSYQKTSMAGVHLEPEAPDMPTTACHGHQLRSELGTMRAPQQSVFLERNRSCMKQAYRTIEVLCTSISGNGRHTAFSQERVLYPEKLLELTSMTSPPISWGLYSFQTRLLRKYLSSCIIPRFRTQTRRLS